MASELWWLALVVACAHGVRLGASVWLVVPSAFLVDIFLSMRFEVARPAWLTVVNVLALLVAIQLGRQVSVIEAAVDIPDAPPPAPPTPAERAIGAVLQAAGFVPVAGHAVLVGDPAIHLWVLVRSDGTIAEVVHTEPHPPGYSFRTQLDPPADGYDAIESVPWTRGWPAPTTRRIGVPHASCDELLEAHDRALAEAAATGARPVPVPLEDALSTVLESDRASARRVLARPWRSMLVSPYLRGRGQTPTA